MNKEEMELKDNINELIDRYGGEKTLLILMFTCVLIVAFVGCIGWLTWWSYGIANWRGSLLIICLGGRMFCGQGHGLWWSLASFAAAILLLMYVGAPYGL